MGKIKVWTIKSVWAILIFSNVLFLNVAYVQAAPTYTANTLVTLTNNARAQNGLGVLAENANLASAAFAKAQDILAKGYFAHNAPDGKTPWDFIKEAGYVYTYAGENLAIGYADANELFTAWMNSPTHRENIVSPNYREIGIAVVEGQFQGTATIVAVQEFGARAENTLSPNPSPSPTTSGATPRPENFHFVKDKSGLNPTSIFAGEPVEIKVVVSGEIKTLDAEAFGEKYNILESGTLSGEKERTYILKQKINHVGSAEVTVTGVGQADNTETINLGTLEVKETAISKAGTSDQGFMANLSHSIKINWYIYVGALALIALIIVIYLNLKKNYATRLADFWRF